MMGGVLIFGGDLVNIGFGCFDGLGVGYTWWFYLRRLSCYYFEFSFLDIVNTKTE